jgi:hypothetical protein
LHPVEYSTKNIMQLKPQINKNLFAAAAEIIINKSGYFKISPEIYMVSEMYYSTFANNHQKLEVIDEISMYRKVFYLVRVFSENNNKTTQKKSHK